jgi:peptidyl-prolyl cis-trans isomerase D
MLLALRNKMSGWPSMVVLGVCVFAVSFFGIESYFVSQNDTFVAKVGKHEISQQEFQNRVNQLRQQAVQSRGEQFDPTYFDKPEIKQQVLDSMIAQQVLLQANTDLGMVVADQRVRDAIAAEPAFQVDGKFNGDAYRALLAGQNMTPATYESSQRSEMSIQLLPEAIAATSLITDADMNLFLKLQMQQRDLRYTQLPRPALTDTTVSDADLQAYYNAHQSDFLVPEQVSVQYLEVKSADLKADAQPTDEQLHKRYEEQKQRYVQPEQREVSHILVNVPKNATPEQQKAALEKAQKIAAEVNVDNFAKIAGQDSDDLGSKRQGGDLGWLEKGVANASFDSALFAMQKGQISQPVLSPDEGYHIIWLRDVRSGTAKPFEEVRADIARDLASTGRDTKYSEVAGKLADLALKDPGSLDATAKEMNLPLQTSAPFGRNGGTGIAANPKVIAAAFSDDVVAQGNNSSIVELEPGHGVVLHLNKHIAAAVPPLAQIRDAVRQHVLDERVDVQAKKHADEMLAQLEKGGDFNALAAAAGTTVATVADAKRNQPKIPPELLARAFLLPRPAAGKPQWAVVSLGAGNDIVLAVDKVTDGDPSRLTKEEREGLRGQMSDALARTATEEFIEVLKARGDVKIAKERM